MLLPRVLRALAVLLVREASSEQVARTALMSRVGGAGLLCGSGEVADVVGLAELLCGGVDDDLRAKFLRKRGMSTRCSVEQAKRGTSKLTTALKALSRLAS